MLQTDGYDDIIDGDELKERVRDWAMKKMATQFQTWKEEHSTRFYCPRPDLKAEALLG